MAMNVGKPPEKCLSPDCGNEEGFTFRSVRFLHDARHEMGALQAQQIPRCRITTWECNACHSPIEIVQDL